MNVSYYRNVAAVLLVGALAACQSSGDATSSPTVYEESPLAAYVSLLGMSKDEQTVATRKAEDLIAQCMKDEGFEYDQPFVPDLIAQGTEDMDPQEWTAVYGYGISTRETEQVMATLSTAARPEAEQVAYNRALYGKEDGLEADGGSAYDWEQEGCMGRAYHEATNGADEAMRDTRYTALFDAIDEVESEVSGSDEVGRLNDRWSQCMADAEQSDLSQPSDAPRSIQVALANLRDDQTDPDDLATALATLREDEIALAVADLACRDKVDYTTKYNQVLWTAQAALVDEYLPDLEALAHDYS